MSKKRVVKNVAEQTPLLDSMWAMLRLMELCAETVTPFSTLVWLVLRFEKELNEKKLMKKQRSIRMLSILFSREGDTKSRTSRARRSSRLVQSKKGRLSRTWQERSWADGCSRVSMPKRRTRDWSFRVFIKHDGAHFLQCFSLYLNYFFIGFCDKEVIANGSVTSNYLRSVTTRPFEQSHGQWFPTDLPDRFQVIFFKN